MDESTLTELLQNANAGGGSTSLLDMNAIMQSLAPFMLIGTILSVLLLILYLISVIGKWRANKAILDIKKLLIEMNERDKLRDEAKEPHDSPAIATPPITTAPSSIKE